MDWAWRGVPVTPAFWWWEQETQGQSFLQLHGVLGPLGIEEGEGTYAR